MSRPGILDRPEIADSSGTGFDHLWIVTVYNNATNTYQEVIEVLMRATGCNLEEAKIETWEIDHLGKSVVHQAVEEECHRVAEVISQIGIRVEVSQE